MNKIFIEKEVLENLYKKHTQAEMLEILNISSPTLRRLFREYGIVTNKSKGKYKTLSKTERDVVIGSILGDGYISVKSLSLNHSHKQLEYLKHKGNLINNIWNGNLYKRVQKDYVSYRIRTEYIDEIQDLQKVFYKDNVKVIPHNIEEYLSPLAIAIWYLDDGGKRGKSCGRIATCSFTFEEVELLSKALNNVFNINTRVSKETKYYTIYIPSKDNSFKIFCDKIRPFVPSSMKYKLIELKCND